MSKQTFMVGIPSEYKSFYEWLKDHDKRLRKKTIEEVEDEISEITWYRICNGNLVEGANSKNDEPLYKYLDIKKTLEQMKEQK